MTTKRKPSGDKSDAPVMESELDQPVDAAYDGGGARFGPPRVVEQADVPEPGPGECLLVDKDDSTRCVALDTSGGVPRTVVDGVVIYERAGDTPSRRPIYRQPVT